MTRATLVESGLVLAAAVVLLSIQAVNLGFCFQDDAYISMRYAQHLADGEGLVYNAGERVEGYTNFLWTLLASVPFLLQLDPERFLWWAGLLSGLLLLAGTASLCWTSCRRASAAGLAALLVAGVPAVVAESVMGLETAFFAGLVTLALARCLAEARGDRLRPLSGVLLALAMLTRPEGYLIAGLVFFGDLAGPGWKTPRFWIRWGSCGALVGSHLGFRLIYYGDIVPNTFHAKVGGGTAAIHRGMGNLQELATAVLPLLLLAGHGAWRLVRERSRAEEEQAPGSWLIPVVAVAYVAYVALVGGDFKPTLRFFAVPIALAAVMAGLSIDAWARRLRPRIGIPLAWSLAGLVLAWSLAAGQDAREFARWRAQQIPVHRAAGAFLGERMPGNDWLATGNAGLIPYRSAQPTIDIVGLCDRHIALRDVTGMGEAIAGHGKGDGEYVLSRQPKVILFQNARFSDRPLRKDQVARRLFSLSEREMWRDPRLHARYTLVSERLPGFYFNFFERTDD